MKPRIHFDEIVRKRPDMHEPIKKALRGDFTEMELILEHVQKKYPVMGAFILGALGYAACGQQVFVVGPKLQRMLLDTAANEIPEDFLKLPFDAFYLATPGCELEIYGGADTKMHKIDGAYVRKLGDEEIVIAIWAAPNENAKLGFDDDAIYWFLINTRMIPRVEKNGMRFLDIDSYIATLLTRTEAQANDIDLRGIPPEIRPLANRDTPKFARLVFNLLLYLASKGVEREVESKREEALAFQEAANAEIARKKSGAKQKKILRRAQRKAADLTAATFTYIGRSIEKSNAPVEQPGKGGATWSVRRGHFHHYWVGSRTAPDGTPRKGEELILKWVLPVYRSISVMNPEKGRHEYRFSEDE